MTKRMDVIILAGGLGTRLRSVVSELPKCMAPVSGRPFLSYILDQLLLYDVGKVVLSVGYLRQAVQDWVAEHAPEYPFPIEFAVEEEPLGTGGGIRLAAGMLAGPDAVVINGDTFFDANLSSLLRTRRLCGKPIALALKRMRDFDRYGTVELMPDATVSAFREKQPCGDGLINGGIYALDLEGSFLQDCPERFSFEREVLEPFCSAGKLCALPQEGEFIDIGIPDDYARAHAHPEMLAHAATLQELVANIRGCDTLLLDRDGVLNRLMPGDYVKSWEEFEWLPGALDALAIAARRFSHIFIVSNQRGVGRGVMSLETLEDIHSRMHEDIVRAGGRLDGIFFSTAVSDTDFLRKPNPGMFRQICCQFPDVQPGRTVMLGDSASDMAFARNCGIHGYIVKNK